MTLVSITVGATEITCQPFENLPRSVSTAAPGQQPCGHCRVRRLRVQVVVILSEDQKIKRFDILKQRKDWTIKPIKVSDCK